MDTNAYVKKADKSWTQVMSLESPLIRNKKFKNKKIWGFGKIRKGPPSTSVAHSSLLEANQPILTPTRQIPTFCLDPLVTHTGAQGDII